MILKNGKRIDGCTDTLPIGTVQPFLGLTPPLGYLVCQGQLISKVEYPELYNICGSTFGTETSTHFYLPDLRGKTIAGYDGSDTAMNTIGKLLGTKTHTHTSAAHTHTIAGHTHTTGNHTLTTSEMPSHSHTLYGNSEFGASSGAEGYYGINASVVTGWCYGNEITINNGYGTRASGGNEAHNHGNTGSTSLTSNSTTPSNTGSNSNFQPTITMNWIVKAAMLIPEYFVVENTLTSTSTSNALSAAQGKILNTSIQTVENRMAAIERGILVKYAEGFDTTSLNIDGLDIDRDGGIYDIYIYAYHNSDSPSDYFMSINNNTTTSYKTIRTFARHTGDTSGQGTAESPFFNADLGHWIIGDACNRFMFKGSLMLLQEQTTKVPRLQGTSTVAENTYQSIVNSGGYFNPNDGVNNITSIQIHGVYFKEIRVYIYKKTIA